MVDELQPLFQFIRLMSFALSESEGSKAIDDICLSLTLPVRVYGVKFYFFKFARGFGTRL